VRKTIGASARIVAIQIGWTTVATKQELRMTERGNRHYRRIRVERVHAREKITLSYPERRNAIGPLMTNELLYALDEALTDDEVRLIVITGEGKTFSTGGDFAQMDVSGAPSALPSDSLPPESATHPVKGDYLDLIQRLMHADKPVIARVNGHALGLGLGIVAACTFSVALADAQFGTPEVNVGLFPVMVMALLQRVVPRRQLLEMMVLGEKIDAADAERFGLINHAVEPGELDETIRILETQILHKSPLTMKLGLRAFAEQEDLALNEAMPLARERIKALLATDDAREGLMAFLAKRQPTWNGR
jgi:enoyl-CoA hydratase/carnithine racemase